MCRRPQHPSIHHQLLEVHNPSNHPISPLPLFHRLTNELRFPKTHSSNGTGTVSLPITQIWGPTNMRARQLSSRWAQSVFCVPSLIKNLGSSWLGGEHCPWQGCPSQLISPKHFEEKIVHKKVWFPQLPAVRQGQPGKRAVPRMVEILSCKQVAIPGQECWRMEAKLRPSPLVPEESTSRQTFTSSASAAAAAAG